MSNKEFNPSFWTIARVVLLVILVSWAFKLFTDGWFSEVAFASDEYVDRDANGVPTGIIPSAFNMFVFLILCAIMSIFGLWPLLGKAFEWAKSMVTGIVDQVVEDKKPDAPTVNPHVLKRRLKELLEFKKRVEDRFPEVVPQPEPPPPTPEELQAQIAELKDALKGVDASKKEPTQ